MARGGGGGGAGVGARLLTHSFPSPPWHGGKDASANSGHPETGAAKCPGWGHGRGAGEKRKGAGSGGGRGERQAKEEQQINEYHKFNCC